MKSLNLDDSFDHKEYDLSKEWVQQFVQSVMQNPDGIEVVLE